LANNQPKATPPKPQALVKRKWRRPILVAADVRRL
jgi:hypothetical protein